MLIALGFRPLKAAVVALVANTAPVAFGALAVPITTLATVSQQPEHTLSQIVGRQTPLLGVFVPMALVFIIDRGRGVRATLPATLTCGITFALAQFVTSNFISTPLTDIVASLVSALAVVLLLRVWQPKEHYIEADEDEGVVAATSRGSATRAMAAEGADQSDRRRRPVPSEGGSSGGADLDEMVRHDREAHDTAGDVFKAYAPYLIIIIVFVVAQLPGIKGALDAPTKVFQWFGMDGLESASGKASKIPQFKFNWLSAAGTLMLIAGLITIPVIGVSPAQALRAFVNTFKQLAAAIVTVMAVLGLAYVMNASGQTTTLGTWMAGAGGAFAILSPILGWIGVAVTGSDTSSNSLFGALQVTAAKDAGLHQALMAAANSSGGVLGKMISPQNLAIAAAAVGMSGREGDIFRKAIGWSVAFLAFMCVLVYLQSTPVLSWMIP
jgi:lactate permease